MAQDNSDLIPLFYAAGEKYNIDPDLLRALFQQESGGNRNVRDSYQGAQGPMQIMPATARGLGITDAHDYTQAIPASAAYLREGFDKTGTPEGALMYYHGGPNQRQWGPKTNAYVPAVTGHYVAMKQGQGDAASKYDDLIKKYGTPSSAAPAADAASSANDYGSLIEKYGTPSKAAPAGESPEDAGQRSIAQSVADQVSGKIPAVGTTTTKDNSPTWMGKVAAAIDPYTLAADVLPRVPSAVVSNFEAGTGLAGQGKQEMLAGNYAPSFPSSDPSSWAAGGVLKTLGGYGAAAMSIPNALVQETIERPATAIGGPDFGQRAGLVAGSFLPVGAIGAVNRRVGPEARALREINKIATPVEAELQRNPSLSLMDVSDEAKWKALNIARQADNPGRDTLAAAIERRQADTAVKDAAGQAFGDALSGAGRVNLQGLPQDYLKKIDEVRQELQNSDLDWNKLSQPEQLHRIQSQMRVESDTLKRSATGSDKNAAFSINNARQQLVDRIDQATGGEYRPVQAKYADVMADEDAKTAVNKEISKALEKSAAKSTAPATAVRKDVPLLGNLHGTNLPSLAVLMGHGELAPLAAASSVGKWAYNRLGQSSDIARNRLLAEVLSAPGMTGVNRFGGGLNPLIPYQLPAALGAGTYAETPPYLNPLLR